MNVTDIVILGVILLSGLFALVRGFVKETLTVAGWVGAAFATYYLFGLADPLFRRFIAIAWLADGAAVVAVFVVSLIILSAVTHAIARHVHQSDFKALDKSLGLVFGLFRGAVLVCLAYVGWAWAVPDRQQDPSWLRDARTMPLVERGARMIEQLIPEAARRRGLEAVGEAKSKAKEGLDAQDAFQKLTQPTPKAATPAKPDNGYKPNEIKEMDRLIDNNQSKQ
jgi:membrane protein required for colicin V production